MSAFGASVGRAVGGLGGPAATTVIVVAGIAAGALGGGAFAAGAFNGGQPAASTGKLSVYPCPETGPVIATVQAGQEVLATGRSEDSTWLRIHFPAPGRTEAWVEAGPLTVDGSVASLPVASCEPELAIASPGDELPAESMTAVLDNPPTEAPPTATPTPTAGPTTGPTPTPNSRPAVASLTASTRQISYDAARYCPNAVKRVTFRVNASDRGGVAGVTLFWREPGAASFAELPMTRVAGTATNGRWEATLDTAANGIDKAGSLAYYAVARDASGATRRIPANGSDAIQVKVCANQGPTITATSSSGNSLYWDPLFAGNCQTATNIVAAVQDSDGVASATLFYRRPGDPSFRSKPMDNTTIKGKWYANLDTLGDKISIKSPPTDVLSWYVRATDSKGASSKLPTKALTIRRCDTEAIFRGDSINPQGNNFCPPNTRSVPITWQFSVVDPDGLVSATLKYTVTPDPHYPGPKFTKTKTVKVSSPQFSIQSVPLNGDNYYGLNQVTWTITTRDQYGGTSSDSSKGTFQIWVC